MSKRNLCMVVVSLVCLLLVSAICYAAEEGVTVGKIMPQFTLKSLNGSSLTVAPSDKVTIINFWATWCPPCRGEMPELNAFYLKYSDKVAFYTVNLGESNQTVKGFMEKNQYSMSVLLDENNDVGDQFRIQYIPTTLVVDQNGVIQFRTSGPVSKSQLESIVNKLL